MNIRSSHWLKRFATTFMIGSMLTVSMQTAVYADVVSTAELAAQSQTETQRQQISGFLAREDVRSQLLAHGVSPGAVEDRLDNLSAAELQQLQERMDEMPAGEGILGAVIGILVIFMLLDIAGVTDIFPAI